MSLEIKVAATYIEFPASRNGNIGTPPNEINLRDFIAKNLQETEWVERFRTTIITHRYSFFDMEKGVVRLPRYSLDKLLDYLGPMEYKLVQVDPVKPAMVKMAMKKNFELRDTQKDLMDFVSSSGSYKPISLQTGGGKTALSIAAVVNAGNPAIVRLPMLIEQWKSSITKFTNIDSKDIAIVQGFPQLKKLWDLHKHKKYQPKFILFSTRTMSLYAIRPQAPYTEIPSYEEFLKEFGIGVNIVDEVHMNFCTNTQLDMQTNVAKNIFLSATYLRSNPQGKRIFNLVFPKQLLYGGQFSEKYCKVYLAEYSLGIPFEKTGKFQTVNGYNHAKYENFLIKNKVYLNYFLTGTLFPSIRTHYITQHKKGQKLLIIVATRNFAELMFQKVSALCKYNKLKCGLYFAGSTPESVLDNDVIISTVKSCGTGRDIKNLLVCFNTVSFSSQPLTIQMMGRLRKLPEDEVVYVDFWNRDIATQQRHARMREYIYKSKAAKIVPLTVN